ncbi:soluble scavenger receptor cysteine-rich domain-containing protein SSC5D-like [Sparus aurata]|uniref:soluble scavenger receptor cysteine-rich domain-containing protein SSC5D-like n=1 Tax=Sparus aurata TaxID=8175 RepID=UPI0011C1BEC7|nr:soluble scavenger receptor cysteine-rich domain-containing protein SSC5D-like [Sparus aurata]
MKMKLVHALLAMAVISALENVATTAQRTTPSTPKPTTPGPHGLNLDGKMFTLSRYSGGISFYPPSRPSTPSYTTSPYYTTSPPYTRKHPYTTTGHPYTTPQTPYTTTKRPYTPTTAPSARGVSVCLRYLTDFVKISNPRIFTLSRASTSLPVNIDRFGGCTLNFNSYSYNTLYLTPSIRFWSNIGPDIWNRVCLTLDSMKNVAQVFSGSNISIRKVMTLRVRPEEFTLNQQMNPAMLNV